MVKHINLMQDIKGMMESSDNDSTSINLRRVEALRNIDAEMANVLSRIGNSQGNDLTKTLITDLRTWVNSTNTQATLRRLSETFNRDTQRKDISKISSPAQITVPEDVRKTVIQQLQGLQQTRFLETGMELYRKEIVKEVKGVIKKNLPSTEDDTESVMSSFTGNQPSDRKERSQALAKNLRQMAPETFLEMVTTTYASLAEFFRRLQTHQKLLLDLTALSGTVPADLSEVLNNIIDISSSRIQKILGVRAEQNSHLAPREFYRPVDARSDIFSWGLVFYEMLSGRRAFREDSRFSTMAAILHKEPDPLSKETPENLREIVARCLCKDPAGRFQAMADAAAALEAARGDHSSRRPASPTEAGQTLWNVSQALGILTKHSGIDLLENKIWIEDRGIKISEKEITKGPRVGVDYAGKDAKLPYRFIVSL